MGSGVIPNTLVKTIAVTSTAVRVTTDTTLLPSTIYFEASLSNTGIMYVGGSDVLSSKYMAALQPGQGIELNSDTAVFQGLGGAQEYQLSGFYINGTAGDVAMATYLNRFGPNTGH